MIKIEKAIALIDGEHYISVIKAALEGIEKNLGYEILAAVLIGGTEKLLREDDLNVLGIPIILNADPLRGIREAIQNYRPKIVIDLSDEPILGYRERFQLASLVLAWGVSYLGADFRFDPPRYYQLAKKPSISIIGTGKRVGKTAISAYTARLFKKMGLEPIVVAMGRGGPEKPEILEGDKIKINPQFLLQASQEGKHAASDYFEDALMSQVKTIGCRRCGGGIAGSPFITNVLLGAELANKLEGKIIIFEGSGASIPPVKTDRTVMVIGANQPIEYIASYMGPYRLILSHLVILAMCEEPMANSEKIKSFEDRIKKINSRLKVIRTIFRPYPLESLEGEKVFLATTSSSLAREKIRSYLEETFNCQVVGISNNLSNRKILSEELKVYEGKYTVLLTELKAAAVDIVTKVGLDLGVRVVYGDNVPIWVGGDDDLDASLLSLAQEAVKSFSQRR